jgi:NAD(P)-dependent dehydrogenase (short-subunit alcohol dehydrogenase family)
MAFFFKGKKAVVTGGASGIGRATAVLLKRLGATVMVGDRQKPAAADGLLYAPCDVADVADLEGLLTGAVSQMGHVDLWYGRCCCRTCAWCLGGWGLGLTLCALC